MSTEIPYIYTNEHGGQTIIILKVNPAGMVTNVIQDGINAFLNPPEELNNYAKKNNYVKYTTTSGGKRSKKQRKSVRKLRRRNASRRK